MAHRKDGGKRWNSRLPKKVEGGREGGKDKGRGSKKKWTRSRQTRSKEGQGDMDRDEREKHSTRQEAAAVIIQVLAPSLPSAEKGSTTA